MSLYTIEISGRPVMVFSAQDQREADDFAEADQLQSDLMVLEHGKKPLWDGKSELFVREAHPEEAAKWDTSFARARAEGDADNDDRESWTVFLLDVSEPADEDIFPDDEDDEE